MDQPRDPLTRRLSTAALAAVPVAFFGVFFVYPVVVIIATGLGGNDRWTAIADVLTAPATRRVLWFTFWQAAVSTAITVVLALPAAYVLGRVRFGGKAVWSAAIVVPFVLPTVVVGTAFIALLGPDGPVHPFIDLRRTAAAVILAHVFFNYAVVVRTVGSAWGALDPRTEDAARVLGASRLRSVLAVSLPQLRGAIGGAGAIVFLFSFTSFGVVKILGGARLATIEVEIHRLTTEMLDLQTAAVLSLVQLAAVVAALGAHRRVSKATAVRAVAGLKTDHRPTGAERGVVAFVLATSAVLVGAPIFTLVERSFSTADGYALTYYRTLDETRRGTTAFVPPLEAIRNSVVIAGAAATIALVVGLCAALAVTRVGGRWRSFFDSGLMLPLGTSAVTIGYGFLIALDEPPLDLRTSRLLVPAAQAVVATPFVIRTILPAIEAMDRSLPDAAAVLGASTRQALWHVELPLLRPAATVAFGFAAAISLGEFGATVFIARASTPTVPVAIYRALGRPGSLSIGQAMAMSTVLMVLTATVMLAVDRVRTARVGTF